MQSIGHFFGKDGKPPRCVVMAGAEVEAGAELQDCLVFPGTRVAAGRPRARSILVADAEIRCDVAVD